MKRYNALNKDMIFDQKSPKSEDRIVDKILAQLTPENIQKQIQEIEAIELPQEINDWIKKYEKVGNRNNFLWKWTFFISKITESPNTNQNQKESLRKVKFLISMLVSLIDDVIDNSKNIELLKKIEKNINYHDDIKIDQLNNQDKECLVLISKIRNYILEIIKEYPRYADFKKILEFDIAQILNAMEYSYLANAMPQISNKQEYWLYSPHTMQVIIYFTLDLMCSLNFDIKKLGSLREIFLKAQKMTRIGNCISTWKREIKNNDFTGGVIIYAISNKIISVNDLYEENKENSIKKIENSSIKNIFLEEWNNEYKLINQTIKDNKEVDAEYLMPALEKLLFLELTSENYK